MTSGTDTDASGPKPPPRSAGDRRALLAQRLKAAAEGTAAAGRSDKPAPALHVPPGTDARVLSFAQERVWFMEQYAPGT
ncbi:hypothetical protein, partial [Nocardioides sp. GXZ039]|uniref:hypothetical protein n=1 Tax=Nocardioides sp. GXZ039 TaxID=3136018 RepID=UPI0030F43FA2